MCGFSGLLQSEDNKRLREAFILASKAYLHERGPDQFAHSRIIPQLTLTHARLSIIDLESGGQPMEDEDGTIVFNGEVYNYQEIKEASEQYRTNSDTEVLLKGLSKYGLPFLNTVDGMFAFAYYNREKRELTLARDLFGIKPLYYFFDNKTFAFASRIPPLMLLSNKEIDRVALAEYYASRASRAPRTIFSDVRELKPGYALTFNIDTFSITSIHRWAEELKATHHLDNELSAIDNLEKSLQLSVKRHLVSDVPVASFLSGGVDSSLLTAMAAQQNPEITAFSIGFVDHQFDESRYAAAVCQRYGLRHHVHYCDHDDFMNYLESWPSIMDDVVADPSAVMLTVLSKFASQLGYKVIISGEGADELFAGYNQYYRFILSRHLATVGKYLPFSDKIISKFKPKQSRYVQFARHSTIDPYFYGTGQIFEPYLLPKLVNMEGIEFEKAASLADALALDWDHRLPDDILTRTDRATMYGSIEARVPFLTRYVWNAASALNENLLIRGKTQKYALKKLAEKYIPHECIYRKKVGFDLPLEKWFRGPLKTPLMDCLSGTWQKDYLNKDFMASVIDDHMQMRNDNADKLWAFMFLENNVKQLRSITLESVESLS